MRRRSLQALILGSIGVFIVFLDTTIVNVAFEAIGHSFHASTGHLAWVLNAYSLVFAAMLIPAGRLADRYGRKRIFIIGLTGFGLMSAFCGVAPNAGVLITARALQAVFAALVVPTSLALILPEFPVARRHIAVGTWGMMTAAAAACGPTLGSLLIEYASWRWIFLVNVPICTIVIIFSGRLLRESRETKASGVPDPAGVVLVAVIPALLSYAIVEGPTRGWSDPTVIIGFVLSVVLLPVFLRSCATARYPVMDLSLFKVPGFAVNNAATLLFATALYGMLLANIIFLQTEWHYSVLRAALGTAPSPLVVTLLARKATKLASIYGPRLILLTGSLSWTVGMVICVLSVDSQPHWLSHWLPANLLAGLGIALTLPVQSGAAVAQLPPNRFAVGSAINSSFRQLGAVLGVSAVVAVLGTTTPTNTVTHFHHVLWVLAAAGLSAGAILFTPWLRRRPVPSVLRQK